MRKFIQSTILSILALVSASSFAGTYDGSYYTDQQRLTMVDSYLKSLDNLVKATTTVGGVTTTFGESIIKYDDTRLLNGKKGYIGSVVLTLKDTYINSTGSSGKYAKETIVHLFDNSVVGVKSVSDPTADCRSFISPTRTSCFGTVASPNPGLIGIVEIKKENPFNINTISSQYSSMNTLISRSYTYIKSTGGTQSESLPLTSTGLFADNTTEMGLIYNALQNSDGTWPTVVVETPPMDIGTVIPPPTVIAPVVTTQDCSNPDFSNKTNASICLVGQIIPGCKISSPNYITSINTPAGNVGLTSVDLKITCSNGVNYHIMPIHENISVQGTDETLKLTGWKDGGRADKLTPLSAKVQSGNGSEQSVPIYFTLEGKGKTAAYGNTIVNPFVGSITYPIQINY